MTEVHLCDVVLQSSPWSIDARMHSKVERRLADLAACATRLSRLELGQVVWRLAPADKVLLLRLFLAPRQQGWLFDPILPDERRPTSLADEAEAVFAQLQQSQVRIVRAATHLAQSPDQSPLRSLDPVAAVVVRRSGQQWKLRRGATEVQWEFPTVEAFLVDEHVTEVAAVVALATARRIELVRVSASPDVGHLGNLTVTRDGSVDALWHRVPKPESWLQAKVRLHRCLFTRQVVGAALVDVLGSNGATPEQQSATRARAPTSARPKITGTEN